MDLIAIFSRYPDHEACIEHLERVRWGENPTCPHCGSPKVAPKADGDRIGRWNCHACHVSFNVLSGTIFQKTRIPLQKWFLAIGLMIDAEEIPSSYRLSHYLDLNQKSAHYMQQRIRSQLETEQGKAMLRGLVKVDGSHTGGFLKDRVA